MGEMADSPGNKDHTEQPAPDKNYRAHFDSSGFFQPAMEDAVGYLLGVTTSATRAPRIRGSFAAHINSRLGVRNIPYGVRERLYDAS
jgi:hypothetical protein